MIRVENMSFEYGDKELYKNVTFTIEDGVHAALIGSNGTGKSTFAKILMDQEEYMYTGKIKNDAKTMGYVSQFSQVDRTQQMTVFDYLMEDFNIIQSEINRICDEMSTAEDFESLMEEYQIVLDKFAAVDGDNAESNVKKQLKTANLNAQENLEVCKLSGGEFKLVQVMREMLKCPDLMVMDEPDVYLDFENLDALAGLINEYKGTMIVITHNRYLLNHCFNKIIHLENRDVQEFDGDYMDYNFTLLQTKIDMQEASKADTEEIERNKKMVEKLRKESQIFTDAARGRALRARVSLLERLEARRIKAPFLDIKQPDIKLSTEEVTPLEDMVVKISDYSLGFDGEKQLLKNVEFDIAPTDKVAIVGPNGTGKTTLLREIYRCGMEEDNSDKMWINEGADMAFLSQIPEEKYGDQLSGGEKNILQLEEIAEKNAKFLLLDEPTSHLDLKSQIALEKAISEYKGAILMVSHDFYIIANCVDYVLWMENNTIRKVSIRKFRKTMYEKYFDKDYLEREQKKKELENRVTKALKEDDIDFARKISEELEELIKLMK